jgi:hypothetical protein
LVRFGNYRLLIAEGAVLWVGLLVASTTQQSATVAAGQAYQYDTPGVRLEGILLERKVFGPPGYGETPTTDEKDTIFVLKLPHVIDVEPVMGAKDKNSASLDPAKNVRKVQLFVDRSQMSETRKLVGKPVVAEGTLNEAVAPSQYTKVWLDSKILSPK